MSYSIRNVVEIKKVANSMIYDSCNEESFVQLLVPVLSVMSLNQTQIIFNQSELE